MSRKNSKSSFWNWRKERLKLLTGWCKTVKLSKHICLGPIIHVAGSFCYLLKQEPRICKKYWLSLQLLPLNLKGATTAVLCPLSPIHLSPWPQCAISRLTLIWIKKISNIHTWSTQSYLFCILIQFGTKNTALIHIHHTMRNRIQPSSLYLSPDEENVVKDNFLSAQVYLQCPMSVYLSRSVRSFCAFTHSRSTLVNCSPVCPSPIGTLYPLTPNAPSRGTDLILWNHSHPRLFKKHLPRLPSAISQ